MHSEVPISMLISMHSGCSLTWSSSTDSRERMRTPSTSVWSSGGDAYEYLTESPKGPTMRSRRSQGSSNESAPHQTSWRGGRGDCVLSSDRLREKSDARTSSLPLAAKAAMNLPLGDGASRKKGPDASS